MTVKVEKLSKSFDHKVILHNVNLEIRENRVSCLIGPNGAGKTTLLKILNLLEKPTRGKIYYDGKDYDEVGRLPLQQRMVLVGQEPVMFNTSVFNNVAYGLKARKKKDIKKKVKRALEMVSLSGIEDRSALSLSGGEAQRVALARALIFDPELIFLDEPTHNLDPLSKKIVEDLIFHLKSESQKTVVLSTHDLSLAERFAHQVYFLKKGKIVEEGEARRIFSSPSSVFSAQFIGIPNLFQGKLLRANRATFLDLEKLKIEVASSSQALEVGKNGVCAFLRPEEILVSRKPFISSARNCFQGKITKMEERRGLVELTADCGIPFVVVLTKRSRDDLNLMVGKKVYLTFKASAVHLMPKNIHTKGGERE
ncbi:MAG: ABC transporter ATP-binding protein [bacterium]